ncbi:MAG: inositol monophosphatase family protein [Gemmatimonadales bacterium]
MRTVPLAARRRYYHAALRFAHLARRVIRRRVARGVRARLKADASFVTDVDLAVERALRAAIGRVFPLHGIIGEEFPPTRVRAEFQWVLDPIDGTTSLKNGIPFYGTIIALHHRGRPLVGVIDLPALDRCYSAAVGLGAWRDRRRLHLKDAPRRTLSREVISVGDRSHFVQCRAGRSFDRLMREHAYVRGYIDCIAHAFAAEGLIGAAVDYGVKLWDIAATQVLIEEAGGRYVCAYRSRQSDPGLYGIICGKPTVVRWLKRLFDTKERR